MSSIPFTPSGASITPTLTAAQQNITVPGTGHFIRVCNGGAGAAWIVFYEASQTLPTLVAGGVMLVPAGAIEVFAVASDTTRVAALGDATGTTLNLTRGEGA